MTRKPTSTTPGPFSSPLVEDPAMPNADRIFNERMDRVMHLVGGAGQAARFGYWTSADLAIAKEVTDGLQNDFDVVDLQWSVLGAWLENQFDAVFECDCRKLAEKFANGTYKLSFPDWYQGS